MPVVLMPHQNSRTSRSMRIVDVALASVLLVLLCPLLILIAVAIRLQSPGPVLVRKSRTGLYVFRTTSGPTGGQQGWDGFSSRAACTNSLGFSP
jgi:sugar transferase